MHLLLFILAKVLLCCILTKLSLLHVNADLAQLLHHWNEWKYCYRLVLSVCTWCVWLSSWTHSYWIHSMMQVQNPHSIKYNGTVQGLKYIWRTEGFRGLFKGNGTNCARIVPNSAVKFFSYEQASKYDSLQLLLHLFCWFELSKWLWKGEHVCEGNVLVVSSQC